ncbi:MULTISPECIES: hypothetical protein [Protofrankia]|uniref:FXSXX-COOH protein n=1 Tax=Protofrankia coriariae TaxID=1562887 RepID=A0ABR5F6Y5_9ACTN|nr:MULTISPECIES: hypothetical protein [Protofrankia]KLL12489.1 hypothetical protein FrCorBMG51_04185 [Protofrankia coriariae]ONH35514.1 hypothetical protein BL254_11245 [Protofrankia sp. BMG5.30]
MPDAVIEWELADVRGIGLDQLPDSTDETLQTEVRRLLDTLALRMTAWAVNGTTSSNANGAKRRQDY